MVLRVMRNRTVSDNTMLARALQELRSRLPASWSVEVVVERVQASGPDTVVRLAGPSGKGSILAIEVRGRLDPIEVEPLVSRDEMRSWQNAEATPVIVARYLGERTRDKLRSLGAGYIDLTGNMYLRLDAPAVAIERVGADKDPEPAQRPARSLKGAKAGRLVRTLVDFRAPLGTREIARISQVDPGYVSRLLTMLEREDLITREPRGPVQRTDWPGLLRAWAKDYAFMTSNGTLSCLQPRGLPALLDLLRSGSSSGGMRYAISGSLAAARRAPVAPARLGVLYVERLDQATERLGLLPADAGANVVLAEPFDDVVFQRTVLDEGLTYVAPSQAVADLLTSPGRGTEEAEALIEWMRANEEAWRA
ncbi:MAG: hypothetical protein C0418_04445 [Coriobacteriaceae bacterium]|nr:hypothetical protein [Coriobacteriaceae bacterium]